MEHSYTSGSHDLASSIPQEDCYRNGNALPQSQSQTNQAGAVISKIEAILEAIVDSLLTGTTQLSIPYRSRTRRRRPGDHEDGGDLELTRRGSGAVTFPGRAPHEAKKFAALLCILQVSREAIATGSVVTKRNIFYQNIELFRHQGVVDSLVDDLAFTLGVGREDLNIVAAAKGLVVGPIRLTMRNNSVIACKSSHGSGTLIPTPRLIQGVDFGLVRWILVIEKEATFRTLAAASYHTHSLAGHGVLLTGKGFPDLITRSFLHTIHLIKPHLPIYALVDYDPDGISIMRTYKTGSKRLMHEEGVTMPELQWLGLRSQDLLSSSTQETRHPVRFHPDGASSSTTLSSQTLSQQSSFARSDSGTDPSQSTDGNGWAIAELDQSLRSLPAQSAPQDALLALSSRDRKTAVDLLRAICDGGEDMNADEMEQQQELQIMLMLNMKAEIQAVDNLGDMTDWLDQRLCI